MQSSEEQDTNKENEEVFTYRNNVKNTFKITDDFVILTIKNNKFDIETKIDFNVKDKIKNYCWSTWQSCKNNKPSSIYIQHGNSKSLHITMLHTYVLHLNGIEKPDDGKTYSVDHINRDTLDNRLENLRWATQSEQNQNKDKNARKYNARALPEGIEEKDIPKFVTYTTKKFTIKKKELNEISYV